MLCDRWRISCVLVPKIILELRVKRFAPQRLIALGVVLATQGVAHVYAQLDTVVGHATSAKHAAQATRIVCKTARVCGAARRHWIATVAVYAERS